MKTRSIILVAIFAALSAIGAFIRIPLPMMSGSMQFFFCVLAGVLLGPKLGALSQAVYLILGLIGLPIFAEGGGLNYIFKPSFGFLLGFILCAFVTGFIAQRIGEKSFIKMLYAMAAGLASVYIIGLPYMYMILNVGASSQTAAFVVYNGCIIFLIPDIIKAVAAAAICHRIGPSFIKNRRIGN